MSMQERLRAYTDIQPVIDQDWPDAHRVYLKVTNQRFCVTPVGCETKDEAEWVRDQLCVALEKLIMSEINGVRTAV